MAFWIPAYAGMTETDTQLSFPRRRESRPIWIRVFQFSGFPLPREQAWIPAYAGMTFYTCPHALLSFSQTWQSLKKKEDLDEYLE